MKYNRRKIGNTLDRHTMYVNLSIYAKVNSKIQITTNQLHVLGIILYFGHKSKMCIQDLNKFLKHKRHSSLSRLVNSLESKKLINTKMSGTKKYLSLSDKGKIYLERLYTIINRQNSDKDYYTDAAEDMVHVLSSYNQARRINI